MTTLTPPDGSTLTYCGRNWTVNAPLGYMAVNGNNLRATVRNPMPACKLDAARNPVPERAFLTGGFFAGIGLDKPTHIHFGVNVIAGPKVTSLWCVLFQLMPFPDQDPATKVFLEPFPSPMLEFGIKVFGGIEYLTWITRFDQNKITTNSNSNCLERARIPLVRGQHMTWDIDLVDSRGGPGGSLRVVRDKGLASELVVVDVSDTPIGFNNDRGSYPSIGVYKDHYNTYGEITDALFDVFSQVN